jgi:hypothetical protein
MKSSKSPLNIVRRKLFVIATGSLIFAILTFAFSLRQFAVGALPTPDKMTIEENESLREVARILIYMIMPLLGCCFLFIAINIWLALRRLRKIESEVSDSEIVNRKS